MGLTQSSVDEFKNQVFGTTMALLTPHLDSSLVFKQVQEIKDSDSHILPVVNGQNEKITTPEQMVNLYAGYYCDANSSLIDKYIEKHIIDKPEHYGEFLQLLIQKLTSLSIKDDNDETVSNQTNIPAPEQDIQSNTNTNVTIHAKGSRKLDKKLNQMMNTIDHERVALEELLQQNLNEMDNSSTVYGPESLHV